MNRVNTFIKKLRSDKYIPQKINKQPTSLTPCNRQYINKKNINKSQDINKENIVNNGEFISHFVQQNKIKDFTNRNNKAMCQYHPQKQAQFQQFQQRQKKSYCSICAIKLIKECNIRLTKINLSQNLILQVQNDQLRVLENWKIKIIDSIYNIFDRWKQNIQQWYKKQSYKIAKEDANIQIITFQQGSILKDKFKLQSLLGSINFKKINVENYDNHKKLKSETKKENNIIKNEEKQSQIYFSGIESTLYLQTPQNELKPRKSLLNNRNISYRNIKLFKKRTITHSNIQRQECSQFILLR